MKIHRFNIQKDPLFFSLHAGLTLAVKCLKTYNMIIFLYGKCL